MLAESLFSPTNSITVLTDAHVVSLFAWKVNHRSHITSQLWRRSDQRWHAGLCRSTLKQPLSILQQRHLYRQARLVSMGLRLRLRALSRRPVFRTLLKVSIVQPRRSDVE